MAYDKKVSMKIKVDQIDKSQLYQGEKGLYLTLTLVPTPNNKYGDDYMVTQYMGKGVDDKILGNGKDLNFDEPKKDTKPTPQPEKQEEEEDELPF